MLDTYTNKRKRGVHYGNIIAELHEHQLPSRMVIIDLLQQILQWAQAWIRLVSCQVFQHWIRKAFSMLDGDQHSTVHSWFWHQTERKTAP